MGLHAFGNDSWPFHTALGWALAAEGRRSWDLSQSGEKVGDELSNQ